jgi:hypothetical protein
LARVRPLREFYPHYSRYHRVRERIRNNLHKHNKVARCSKAKARQKPETRYRANEQDRRFKVDFTAQRVHATHDAQ